MDEETLLQDLAEYGESIKGRLYDWFKANPKTKPIPFTTTFGNYDPTHSKWYLVIDREAEVLMIVER